MLSLAFQDEDIDTVSSLSRLETAKKQFIRIEKKEFEDLPTVSRFLDKVEESNEAFSYQNVVLKSFENAKESARKLKNVLYWPKSSKPWKQGWRLQRTDWSSLLVPF